MHTADTQETLGDWLVQRGLDTKYGRCGLAWLGVALILLLLLERLLFFWLRLAGARREPVASCERA